MRAVIQRVTEASVYTGDRVSGSIGPGLLILAGFEEMDSEEDIEWISGKILRLRIFSDNEGIMNLSVTETSGDLLLVSQFTLHANTKKGNRPSYIRAARPETAIPLYQSLIRNLTAGLGKPLQTGEFGAMMRVQLVNDGPVTIIIDTKNRE
jgi:D-tyrosyl-tRNA(Tyr) deacylase